MGEIVWLGRYPVKSMLGEELPEALLGPDGVDGDRRYAVVDEETGLVASAKNPAKWREMLQMTARYRDGHVTIRRSDGAELPEAALPAVLGRPVRLTGTGPGGAELERLTPPTEPGAGVMTRNVLAGPTFVDFGAVHVITTATLDALGADARRFRPNIVVRMAGAVPFEENDWPGGTLAIGDGAEVGVIVPTPRCVVPTLAHGDLPEDPGVMRTAARLNRVQVFDAGRLTCVGAYGSVVRGGRVRVGDRVHIHQPEVVGRP